MKARQLFLQRNIVSENDEFYPRIISQSAREMMAIFIQVSSAGRKRRDQCDP